MLSCCICMEKIKTKFTAPSCNHTFCNKCISIWLTTNDNCPMCRSLITSTECKQLEDENPQISIMINTTIDETKTIIDRLEDLIGIIHYKEDPYYKWNMNNNNIYTIIRSKNKITKLLFKVYKVGYNDYYLTIDEIEQNIYQSKIRQKDLNKTIKSKLNRKNKFKTGYLFK